MLCRIQESKTRSSTKPYEKKATARKNQHGLPIPQMLEKKGGKAKPYEEWTKNELYAQAKNVGIEGRSKMKKKELIHALRNN